MVGPPSERSSAFVWRPDLFFEMSSILGAVAVEPNPAMIAPFAILLLAIALMPFLTPSWWHHHYPKVAVGLGAVTAAYYLLVLDSGLRLLHIGHEYVSFIALIGSLFVVAGGIHIRVKGEATPAINCLFLLLGGVLANLIGTTGASMVLIRPWIRMNRYRVTGFHVVFFIFIVSNVGGCLTPIGDPPLFLGYLKGVPFWWTLKNCVPAWLLTLAALLAIFYAFDRRNFLRAPREVREAETAHETWRFEGLGNVGFLAVILAAVFIEHPVGLREVIMVAAAIGSFLTTSKQLHAANDFTFDPVREVAWLFLGIFFTMAPALDYLEHHAASVGLDSPMKFYWGTGLLSAALDNAPTYLTFLAAALGGQQLSLADPAHVAQFAKDHNAELLAISLGAVFFGAMTYIGNGPNFMVKAIAQRAKVHTPGFFDYLLRYAVPILIPIFLLVAIVFMR